MKTTNMKNGRVPLLVLALLFMAGEARSEIVLRPKEVGAAIDFGQIRDSDDKLGRDVSLSRTGVYLTSSGIYNRKTDIRVTIGGLFWYPLKEATTTERLVRFGPGVGQAQAIHSFGDPENPTAKLQFGLFPYKYNPDAQNLGEYLYRSGTYPGYLWTGGWSYINSASYMAEGVHLNLPMMNGLLTHDFTLFLERDIEPTNDFSPGYVLTVKPAPFVEIGGGVVWSHALSINPGKLSPNRRSNAYSKTTGMPINGAATDPDAVRGAQTLADTAGNLGYYTFRGFKTMGRVSFDFGTLLGMDAIKAGDFKLYSEIALLGVEDQPFYYDHKTERMPIMVGVNIPTFGILDKLNAEVEYHKSRFQNTVGLVYDRAYPVPLDAEADNPYDYTDEMVDANKGHFGRDDWHWSIYANRRIVEGVTLHAQAASDHLRHFGPEVKPDGEPATNKPEDWYYIVRLEFGLF